MASSPDPDRIECPVPFLVDEDEIFFGPCKKDLRQQLRQRLLAPDRDVASPDEDLYLIGFNAGNRGRKRKIVWAGRIKRAMTFACAWDELAGPRYEAIRNVSHGPLHVEPIRHGDGRLAGYRHATRLHAHKRPRRPHDLPRWIADLTSKTPGPYRVENEKEIYVTTGLSPWHVFERDVCFLLENLFWASGSGIEVDDEIVAMLREAQPDRPSDTIDGYAVFGLRQDGSADGRTGSWLAVEEGGLVRRLLAAVEDRARRIAAAQGPFATPDPRTRCDHPRARKRDAGQPTPPAPLRRPRPC